MFHCSFSVLLTVDNSSTASSRLIRASRSRTLTVLVVIAGVLVTAADAFVLLLVEQWGVRQLEAVFGIFIAIMACSFGVMYSNADIPQGQVLEGQLLHSRMLQCM